MAAQGGTPMIRLDLTQEQRDKISAATGRRIESIELTVEELEQRVVASLVANCNETLLKT